jgi:hypothetical protein
MEDSVPVEAPVNGEGQTGGRKKWMALVMAEKKAHPSWSLGQAMKSAKKKYRKSGKKTRKARRGGADEEAPMMGGMYGMKGGALSPLPLNGGRRRKSKKGSRKH